LTYNRAAIEEARQALSQGAPPRKSVRDIPPDAPYVGKGPLFVWTGDNWLDWNDWVSFRAPLIPDGAGGGEDVSSERSAPPPSKPPRRAAAPSLFDIEDETA
jgi:hypothetical protein